MPSNSQNDPNWGAGGAQGPAALGAAIGAATGYVAGWEGLSLWHGLGALPLREILHGIHQFGLLPDSVATPLGAAIVAGGAAGAWLGWRAGWMPPEVHIRGRQLVDAKAAARALLPAKGDAPGVRIHPQIPISQAREARHMLLLGGSGSGKTTILWPILNQAIERGDQVLLFSFKSDFQQKMSSPFSLLAPWDTRSAVWQLGRDVATRLDAEALAATLVPTPDREPQWAQGAQALLSAVIAEVQERHGAAWGFGELGQEIARALSNYDRLVELVEKHVPVAKALLLGKDSKTTGSYLATMATKLTPIVNLAVAQHAAPRPWAPWSVQDWLAGNAPRVAVLGYSPRAPELSRGYGASVLEQVLRQILAAPDCAPEARRIWLVLDEVPQLGRVPSITQALEAARSKGCRVILGMQSIRQLQEHGYGQDTAEIWAGQTAAKIIASIASPADQRWAADLLGDREIERFQRQTAAQQGGGATRTSGYSRVREPVMPASAFGTELRVTPRGPRALLLTPEAAAVLDWPFPKLVDQRPPVMDAAWILPGFQRPAWGRVPPAIDPALQSDAPRPAEKPKAARKAGAGLAPSLPGQAAAGPSEGEGQDSPVADALVEHAVDHLLPGLGLAQHLMELIDAASPAPGPALSAPLLRQAEDEDEGGR